MEKVRLDVFLVEKGFFKTRQKAQEAIEQGIVYVCSKQILKSSYLVQNNEANTSEIEIKGEILPFVSRGGMKLDRAIKTFKIDVTDLVCLDIGSSTGGFTDCLLQNGAKYVYAIDVGTNQLADELRKDKRVKCMEQTNFRYLQKNDLDKEIDFFCTDVSFISLEKILPNAYNILKDSGEGVALIKPQFELTKRDLTKKGVVKDKKNHIKVIKNIIEFSNQLGFEISGLDFSPIRGPEGNIEFLIYLKKAEVSNTKEKGCKYNIEQVVEDAHKL